MVAARVGAEAKKIAASLPAVIWLSYGVHGNEISSSDAALAEAYHLLAAQGDAGEEIDQAQDRQQRHGGVAELRQHHELTDGAGEHQ